MPFLRRACLTAAAVALAAIPALGLEKPSGVSSSMSLTGLEPATYTLDPTHVILEFGVSHMGFSLYRGRFNTVTGAIEFNPAEPEKSSVKIDIETASVDLQSDKLAEELRGAEMFDSAQHPKATFVSTAVEKTGEATGRITGDLTIKGVTKPVALDVTFNGTGVHPFRNVNVLGFTATGSFKRSEFGLSNWLSAVGDEVILRIDAEFLEEAP